MPRDPGCRLCPLGGAGTSTCVWGRLGRTALTHAVLYSSMCVGEAPGQQEDQDGKPFVGPSGRLLDDAFAEVGLTDVWLTNTVKCRPCTTKNPKPEHVKACAPYLDEEIDTLKPTAILALGAIAWHRLGGKGSITENEGKEIWSDKYGCWIMPARHPAFILRAMGHRSSWIQVLHRFKRLLEGQHYSSPPVDIHLIQYAGQLDMLASLLHKAEVVVYDFETMRVPWWQKDHTALTVSFSVSAGKSFILPLGHPQSMWTPDQLQAFFSNIRSPMTSDSQKHVAHNAVFDDLVWYRLTGYLPYLTYDTMAGSHVLDENRPRALKWLGRSLLGWPDWGISTADLSKVPLDQVARYNGYDTAATWALRELQIEELKQDPRLHGYFAGVVMPGLRVVDRIVATGLHVNSKTLANQIVETMNAKMRAQALIPVANPGSTQQIAKWLYEDLALPVLTLTENGAPSTDEETIQSLALRYPGAKKVLDYRKPAKNLSAYLLPIDEMLRESYDGRVHHDIKIGPKTGRFASRLHTTPRETGIRGVYDAPSGSMLFQADYKQIETRLVAWAACGRPSTWEQAALSGGLLIAALADPKRDVYVEMAAAVLSKSLDQVTRDANGERQIMGKVPTLAMLYDISPQGLRDYAWREFQIVWSLQEARHIWSTFYRLWPEIRTWQQREEMIVAKRGWNQSALGRKIRVPDAMLGGPTAHEAMKTGLNQPIQSLASDITLTAAVLLQRKIDSAGLDKLIRIVGFVHDALLVEAPEMIAHMAHGTIRESMLQAPAYLSKMGLMLPDGLIQVDIAVGPWGSKKALDVKPVAGDYEQQRQAYEESMQKMYREAQLWTTLTKTSQTIKMKNGNTIVIPRIDSINAHNSEVDNPD